MIPVAVLVALVAARMTTRYSRLAGWAIGDRLRLLGARDDGRRDHRAPAVLDAGPRVSGHDVDGAERRYAQPPARRSTSRIRRPSCRVARALRERRGRASSRRCPGLARLLARGARQRRHPVHGRARRRAAGSGRAEDRDGPTRRCSAASRRRWRSSRRYRMHGHLAARLDPLGSEPIGDPALEPSSGSSRR